MQLSLNSLYLRTPWKNDHYMIFVFMIRTLLVVIKFKTKYDSKRIYIYIYKSSCKTAYDIFGEFDIPSTTFAVNFVITTVPWHL